MFAQYGLRFGDRSDLLYLKAHCEFGTGMCDQALLTMQQLRASDQSGGDWIWIRERSTVQLPQGWNSPFERWTKSTRLGADFSNEGQPAKP